MIKKNHFKGIIVKNYPLKIMVKKLSQKNNKVKLFLRDYGKKIIL